MFQIAEMTEAHVASVTNRIEKHGDENVPAVSIKLEITGPNTMLDMIDPKIREALYKPVEGQENIPGVELVTPVLRCNAFDKHTLPTKHEGWTLNVDDGIDQDDPMVFGSVKVDKFIIEAKQGGTIILGFRVGTSDVDAQKLGKLAMHNGESIWFTLIAPKPQEKAIDGTQAAFEKDHPDATDLFSDRHAGDPDQTDSEGGETDISGQLGDDDGPRDSDSADYSDGMMQSVREQPADNGEGREAWPFPRDFKADNEAAPQSVTTEVVKPKRAKRSKKVEMADGDGE